MFEGRGVRVSKGKGLVDILGKLQTAAILSSSQHSGPLVMFSFPNKTKTFYVREKNNSYNLTWNLLNLIWTGDQETWMDKGGEAALIKWERYCFRSQQHEIQISGKWKCCLWFNLNIETCVSFGHFLELDLFCVPSNHLTIDDCCLFTWSLLAPVLLSRTAGAVPSMLVLSAGTWPH